MMIYLGSIPRCGSTYLFRSIAGLPQGSTTPEPHQSYGIVKTHRVPSDEKRIDYGDGDQAIFLFGDVATAVVSTQRHRHDPKHFRNLGRGYDPDVDLLEGDYLGYTELFEGWYDAPFPVLFVRYSVMRDTEARRAIERWIERGIQWLPWRKRRTEPSAAQRRQVEQTYSSLVTRTQEMPPMEVRR